MRNGRSPLVKKVPRSSSQSPTRFEQRDIIEPAHQYSSAISLYSRNTSNNSRKLSNIVTPMAKIPSGPETKPPRGPPEKPLRSAKQMCKEVGEQVRSATASRLDSCNSEHSVTKRANRKSRGDIDSIYKATSSSSNMKF